MQPHARPPKAHRLSLTTTAGRRQLAEAALSPAGRQVLTIGLDVIDHVERQRAPLDGSLVCFARRQPGCRALAPPRSGIGHLTAVFIWAALGHCARLASSADAVRYAGLDITVYESADKRPPGQLSRQRPEALRWALYEATQSATRRTSPEGASDQAVRHRLNHKRACLSVARKLCRRAYPILRALGEDALAPVDPRALPPLALVGRSAPGARSRGGRAAATAQHDAAG